MNTLLELGLSNALVATVLAVAAFVLTRFARRPHFVFAVWLLVLAKLVVPPIVGLPLATWRSAATFSDEVLGEAPASSPSVESFELAPDLPIADLDPSSEAASGPEYLCPAIALEGPPVVRSPASWLTGLIFGIWLAGAGLWFAVAAVRVVRFHRILRHADHAPSELREEIERLARRVGLRQAPLARLVHRRAPPLVWAMIGRATILLPAELLPALSDEEREALLTHELVHLTRRDHLLRWAELIVLGLYWWHPVAWWARRHVARAAEECCDERVVALLGSARAYAEALLATVDFLAESRPALPLGASGFSQAPYLRRRLEMILHSRVERPAARTLRFSLLAIGLTALPLSVDSLWAEPSGATIETVVTDPAPASAVVEPVKEQPTPPTPAAAAQLAKPASEPAGTIEARLERLEKMIQKLAEQKPVAFMVPMTSATPAAAPTVSATPAKVSSPTIASQPTPKAVLKVSALPAVPSKQDISDEFAVPGVKWRVEGSGFEVRADNIELAANAEKSLEEFRKQAEQNVKLSETNYNRRVAAEKQFEAVKAAYEAETVTLDQLLEAQRRLAEAQISYARTASDLATDPVEREYFRTLAFLKATTDALNNARQTWKKVHAAYVVGGSQEESKEEAQAREQYFQFKTQSEQMLNGYLKAKKAYETRRQSRR